LKRKLYQMMHTRTWTGGDIILKERRSPFRGVPRVVIIISDASKEGWRTARNGCRSGYRWTNEEAAQRIDMLELQAARFALKSLCRAVRSCHIRWKLDNTTAVAYVNNMGSQRASWQTESERNCWLWSQSVGAECQQFTYLDQLTWTVNPRFAMITQNGNCFQNNNNKTWKALGKGYMHLFASRPNT